MHYKPVHRDAIAMIELIFAIVIIGIVLMSSPMLMSRSTQSNITAFQQESVAILASHINAIMSYPWDPNNNTTVTETYLLTTTNGSNLLDSNATRPKLRGATDRPLTQRTRLFLGGGGATVIPAVGAPFSNINDFNGNNRGLQLYTAAANQSNVGGYIDKNVTIGTLVRYNADAATYNAAATFAYNFINNDAAVLATTNIKRIITTLTSVSPDAQIADKTITLRAFMCNIGAASPRTKGGI